MSYNHQKRYWSDSHNKSQSYVRNGLKIIGSDGKMLEKNLEKEVFEIINSDNLSQLLNERWQTLYLKGWKTLFWFSKAIIIINLLYNFII